MQNNFDSKDCYKEGTLEDTTDAYRTSSASNAASSASSVNGFIGNALIGNALIGFFKVNEDIKPFKGIRNDMAFMVTYIDIHPN